MEQQMVVLAVQPALFALTIQMLVLELVALAQRVQAKPILPELLAPEDQKMLVAVLGE